MRDRPVNLSKFQKLSVVFSDVSERLRLFLRDGGLGRSLNDSFVSTFNYGSTTPKMVSRDNLGKDSERHCDERRRVQTNCGARRHKMRLWYSATGRCR